jgi:hypothetical protein
MRRRIAFLAALVSGCGAPSGFTINVVAGSDVVRPPALAVSWFGERGVLFERQDVAVPAQGALASIFVYVDRHQAGDRRVLVRGAGAAPSIGALRIPVAGAASQTFTVTLSASLPDVDGDGLPDVIDDCPRGSCDVSDGGGATADGGAHDGELPDAVAAAPDADPTGSDGTPPAPDAQAPPDAQTPPADVASADGPIRDATPAADASTPGLPVTAGLVALWQMEESGGVTVHDRSPTHNAGTIVRPTGADWTEGHRGAALALTGTSWMSVPSSPSYDADAGLTLSAWVYWDRATQAGQVVMARQRGSAYQNVFWLGLSLGRVHFSVEDQGVNGVLPAGRWVHLAGTYDGSRVILYLDGTELARANVAVKFVPGDRGISVGADLNGAGNSVVDSLFVGRLDDVAIYDRALSPAEIGLLSK